APRRPYLAPDRGSRSDRVTPVSPSAVPGRLAAAGDLRQRLRDHELFCRLTEDQLDWGAGSCELQELGDGDVLLREGEQGSRFYALLDGELVVSKVMGGRDEVLTRHVV